MLAPVWNVKGRRRPRIRANQTPNRIPQQTHVGRRVHVCLNHPRIATTAQCGARLFSGHPVTRTHDQLNHTQNQLWSQQLHVVDQSLPRVLERIKARIAMPQPFSKQEIVVRLVQQRIVVQIQTLLYGRNRHAAGP